MNIAKMAAAALILAGCTATGDGVAAGNGAAAAQAGGVGAAQGRPFQIQPVGQFDQPWAMTFLPGTNQALITERAGRLLLWSAGAQPVQVQGLLAVDAGGQGGLGDVVLHPNFARNRLVYLSWVQPGEGDTRGAVVGRGRLVTQGAAPRIEGLQIIWRQEPKVTGRGHFGHRLAFSPDGHLFITNGEREKFTPAQDPAQTLGKIVRLRDDGSVPADNPWARQGGVAAQLWTMGHRNPLGIAFAADGRLWSHEMGPRQGDEFNLIERGANYGYPIVSNGNHYDGRDIPDHPTRPEFRAPVITWNGVSPAGLMIYSGRMFPQWRGSAFLGGLSGRTLIRVAITGATAREAERWDMGARIREVEQGPDGAIYVLEDTRGGTGGRLLRLTAAR
jgi:glucose/arabinose dehydrogenase